LVSLAHLPELPAEQFDATMDRCFKGTFSIIPGSRPEPTGQPDVDVQSDQSARMRHQRNAVAVGQVDNYLGVAPMGDICER